MIEEKHMDDGPWFHEPNLVMFEIGKLPCLLYRNTSSMVFCGYVGIPKGHHRYERCRGMEDSECQFAVHGGITYSREALPGPLDAGVFEDFWWLGFDCGHLNCDYVPNFPVPTPWVGPEDYKTVQFAITELIGLATQIAAGNTWVDTPLKKEKADEN